MKQYSNRILFVFLLLLLGIAPWQSKAEVKSTGLTINVSQATLVDAFKQIEKVSGYTFLYKTEDVKSAKSVSFSIKNGTIAEVMNACLANSGMEYEISDGVIILRKKEAQKQVTTPLTDVIEVRGVVKDMNNETLVGATIKIKGTNTGVISGINGEFLLKAKVGQILTISFIGMKPQDVVAKDASFIQIKLEASVAAVDEVVVNGYFVSDKKTYTGAAVSISKEEIMSVSNTNIFQAINAIDPSFLIVENNIQGSNPNSLPSFQLRGASGLASLRTEFSGDPNLPTFIVDGFERSLEYVFDIDPTRIESITVLKDAAAAAVYGSRSANGVVVVELTKPTKGKLSLSYNLKYILTTPDLTDYSLLNAADKLEAERLGGLYDIDPMGYQFNDEYNMKLKNVLQGYDTYWLSKPLTTGRAATHSINLQGGDEFVTYQFNIGVNPVGGVMIGSDRKRYSLGNNLTYRFKNINFTNSINYNYVDAINSPYGNFSQYAKLNPYYRTTDDNGDYLYQLQSNPDVFNPLWNTTLNVVNRNNYNTFAEGFMAEWSVFTGLKVKASGGVNITNENGKEFYPSAHTMFGTSTVINERGRATLSNSKSVDWQSKLGVSYSKLKGKHNLISNLGIDYNESNSSNYSFSVQGLPFEKMEDVSFASAFLKGSKPTGYNLKSRSSGIFLTTSYVFNSKLYADFSLRSDISSRFGKDARWASFWSLGAGYNMDKEAFVKSWGFVDLLKFRGSFGYTGSQNFDPGMAKYIYNYTTDLFYNGYGVGTTLKALGNNNLKWQRSKQLNFGIDFGFLKNRLLITGNIYDKTTTDLIVPVSIAPSLGFKSYNENLGEVKNRGYDISLRGVIVKTNDLNVSLSLNGTYNSNKLMKISNALKAWNSTVDTANSNIPTVRYIVNQPTNAIWAVPSAGIDPATGDELFINKNGDYTYLWNPNDQKPYFTEPGIQGTFGVNIRWKKLMINSYIRYSYGSFDYNSTLVQRVENAVLRDNVDSRVLYGRWQKPGDVTFFKDIKDKYVTKPTSRFIQKNNYLSMSSLNISYEFEQNKINKLLGMKSLKLGFNMDDVFYVSTIKKERGLDYPYAHTFNFSLITRF